MPKKKASSRKAKSKKNKVPFDRFRTYEKSVQSPDVEMEMVYEFYEKVRNGRAPRTMREDFCGTFANSREWVKMGPYQKAWG
ncbi:MAG: class I SAM-dependent methyltransferase, partial [Bdellovibrionales bacterium]|nr:class I SAM-dependent methyltransferase [Bdellovibrionales bacterium]